MNRSSLKNRLLSIAVVAMVACFAFAALTGCSANSSLASSSTPASENRTYMSNTNSTMSDISSKLDTFATAVSAQDVTSMQRLTTEVSKLVNDFKAVQAPDAMKDIHSEYSAGCDGLVKALNDYVSLYSEMASGTFDQASYDDRIATIQGEYDEGLSHLKSADEKAASLS